MKKYTILPFFLAMGAVAQATVTININTSGWGDNNSSGVNGLAWGILVDSDTSAVGSSFDGSFLDDFSAALDGFAIPNVSGFGGVATPTLVYDEYYFIPGNSITVNGGPPFGFADGLMESLGASLDLNVDSGDDYGLVWFSTGVGTLGSSDFFGFQDLGVLPSDGSTIDPVTTPGLANNAIGVPEPSAFAAMAGLMALG